MSLTCFEAEGSARPCSPRGDSSFSQFTRLSPLDPVYLLDSEGLRGLHLSCAMCPFLAVVRVNSAPHRGQKLLDAVPDFSRWWRKRLLNVENWRPLQPCSQHWGLGRELMTRGMTLFWLLGDDDSAGTLLAEGGGIPCGGSYGGYAAGVVDVGGYMVGSGWYSLILYVVGGYRGALSTISNHSPHEYTALTVGMLSYCSQAADRADCCAPPGTCSFGQPRLCSDGSGSEVVGTSSAQMVAGADTAAVSVRASLDADHVADPG
jgi:hypothetical protein